MNSLEIITSFLKENPIQILSTSSDKKPISRPIGSFLLIKNKLCYCMNKNKAMHEQLCQNPFICICVCAKDFTWLRLHAKIKFSDDLSLKQEFINQNKTRFKDPKDINFAVFYLTHIKAELHKGLEIQKFEF
ncbi:MULTISPECIES: pyridoxamine 5'-phosphate oxidase family protein [unclassified Campylobacter]|uniref:pyridoxamine 5'-phosphate oxidase family protein n=1 Tax=unclassified Campylobacter TaxID=2593542 RepID=UPI001237CDE4|nr:MULTISPECIES: pyridoxamine 5'-phosphate oxidase family protein [unclassified Campylobacter]KAA6227180.1 hypothetical protein FMM57_04380 [Campylobacter sp. LR286c]KAA6227945.1 hypothetical protein FMM54_02095 [Campylobacter sp. LR185c]KAA6228355.1 hypothetical protein FMM55_01905 [Campylobacter sp. LR196d]KAA6229356.1 hypothetical protein FMM58_08340 [Campylobacter sp. LR291e]KAA6231162.1 hypothetical protein FMM56_05605 [Campylobacter sp. LR264d]